MGSGERRVMAPSWKYRVHFRFTTRKKLRAAASAAPEDELIRGGRIRNYKRIRELQIFLFPADIAKADYTAAQENFIILRWKFFILALAGAKTGTPANRQSEDKEI